MEEDEFARFRRMPLKEVVEHVAGSKDKTITFVIAQMELDRRMRAPDRIHEWRMFAMAALSAVAAFAAVWMKS
jgi:hypothetical protein